MFALLNSARVMIALLEGAGIMIALLNGARVMIAHGLALILAAKPEV